MSSRTRLHPGVLNAAVPLFHGLFRVRLRLLVQVQALEVERRTLESMLETCRDELGDAKSLVEQLRLENTRKVKSVGRACTVIAVYGTRCVFTLCRVKLDGSLSTTSAARCSTVCALST